MVIKKLIELIGLTEVKIHICPTVRETDGLAMSSRNMRLNNEERKKAVEIYNTLSFIKKNIKPGKLAEIKQKALSMLDSNGFKVDYIEITDAQDLEKVNEWNGKQKIVVLAAAYLNDVRLIDNMLLN